MDYSYVPVPFGGSGVVDERHGEMIIRTFVNGTKLFFVNGRAVMRASADGELAMLMTDGRVVVLMKGSGFEPGVW